MLEFIQLKKEHIDLQKALTLKSFGRAAADNFYQWKYYDNPAGEVVGYAAYDTEKKVFAAYYGAIPEMYEMNGERKIIYQSCDTMTSPDYRRQGLFVKLANLCYDKLKEENNLFVKGFAGEQSYPGFVKKLGWENLERIKPHFKVNAHVKMSQVFKVGLPKSIQFEEFNQLEDTFEDLTPYYTSNGILKTRDSAYLNWRLNEPNKEGKVVLLKEANDVKTYAYFNIENNLLLIRDFVNLTKDKQYIKHLFNYLQAKVLKMDLKGIYSWTNSGSANHQILKQQGFIQNPFNKGPMVTPLHFIILKDGSLIDSATAANGQSWNLLPLDYDF